MPHAAPFLARRGSLARGRTGRWSACFPDIEAARAGMKAAEVLTGLKEEVPSMPTPDMQKLLEAGVHFGHQTHRWNPKMKPYIFMKRNGIHIIDLAKTLSAMEAAGQAITDTVRRGEQVLFVCTKKQGQTIICEEATRSSMPYVAERWLGGTLTNLRTIRASVARLENIERMGEGGTYDLISKKEAQRYEKEKAKLARVLDGIRTMDRVPGLLFVVDTRKEKIALNEADRLGIPVVGICDTNADPEGIEHPIPGNDDAIRSIRLFSSFAADCVIEGKASVLEGREPVETAPAAGLDAGGAARS
jgi:small subunit ribosomal protein S2